MFRSIGGACLLLMLVVLSACVSRPRPASESAPAPEQAAEAVSDSTRTGAPSLERVKSRWLAVDWTALPGFEEDNLSEAWGAWIKSCERPASAFVTLCKDVRMLSIASQADQRAWMRLHLQPYRVESHQAEQSGLLTGYFEPQLEASRTPTAGFKTPLYGPPAGLAERRPWFSRSEIDTQAQAQAALKDRVIAYVEDPVDALILQIQGSGRVRLQDNNASAQWIRLAYAATNGQPYRSVGRWLLDQGLVKDASWPAIKNWLAQNPQRQKELLWSNPRVVFFKEEKLSEWDADFGPKGAQGVALTAGRSIAVDPQSIPYGAPVWLVSRGKQTHLQKLVLAQDTGTAITGAVRADYFAGWGAQAEALAGQLKQPLQLWVLWPK